MATGTLSLTLQNVRATSAAGDTVFDDFERTELGPNWVLHQGTVTLDGHNVGNVFPNISLIRWAGQIGVENKNQFAAITFGSATTGSNTISVKVHTPTYDYYAWLGTTATSATVRIQDGWGTIYGETPLAAVPQIGDRLRIAEVDRSTLIAFFNDAIILTSAFTQAPGAERHVGISWETYADLVVAEFTGGIGRVGTSSATSTTLGSATATTGVAEATGTLTGQSATAAAATATVDVTGTLGVQTPATLASTGQVTVLGTGAGQSAVTLTGAATVLASGDGAGTTTASLTATASGVFTGSLDLQTPVSLAASGQVAVTGALSGQTATAPATDATVLVAATFGVQSPAALTSAGTVPVTGSTGAMLVTGPEAAGAILVTASLGQSFVATPVASSTVLVAGILSATSLALISAAGAVYFVAPPGRIVLEERRAGLDLGERAPAIRLEERP